MRVLRNQGRAVVGLDILDSAYTDVVASVCDRDRVREVMRGVTGVIHAATLHKPHVGTHTRQQFVDTNVAGTLTLLEEAAAVGVSSFVFTSTTSAFGRANTPAEGEPAAWITEQVVPVPRNIYGVTKTAAEDLCALVHADAGLPVLILRTSRFFPEEDDRAAISAAYLDANVKVNEMLYRRVDLQDAVDAHLLALERAPAIGFDRFIISATTPFTTHDLGELPVDAPSVVRRLIPEIDTEYGRRGWRMFPGIERVYVNARARAELGWTPRFDFRHALACLARDEDPRSPLAREVGAKGYHATSTGPYTLR